MHLPLYLEWAPLGIVSDNVAASKSRKGSGIVDGSVAADEHRDSAPTSTISALSDASKANSIDVADDMTDYSTLFIKNLSFGTAEEGLSSHIQAIGLGSSLRLVSIPRKPAPSGSGTLSMGFGFAEFRNSASASEALQRLSGSLLDGHALQVKPSDKRLSVTTASVSAALRAQSESGASDASAGKGSSKIIVRNVAFQATVEELRSLFAAYGTLKRVRIPKKMGGAHRGFAFVEYSSAQEAAAAMTALEKTHFYGRHLILEWAKADEEVGNLSELRKRSQIQENILSKAHGNNAAKRQRSGGATDELDVEMGDEMY
jgi:multiple RNA-binding domain-containing protein 1